MTKRKPIKTTITQAIDYWISNEDELNLSIDWEEASNHCWRCGCENNLDRCHIIPDALGGEDHPSNIVLLCKRCHSEGPNVNDKQIMWDWIRAYRIPWYDTFWMARGMIEYKFIYKKAVSQEIIDILERANIKIEPHKIKDLLDEIHEPIINEASIHFGQPYFNSATIAGLIRMGIKRLAERYNVSLSSISKEQKEVLWYLNI